MLFKKLALFTLAAACLAQPAAQGMNLQTVKNNWKTIALVGGLTVGTGVGIYIYKKQPKQEVKDVYASIANELSKGVSPAQRINMVQIILHAYRHPEDKPENKDIVFEVLDYGNRYLQNLVTDNNDINKFIYKLYEEEHTPRVKFEEIKNICSGFFSSWYSDETKIEKIKAILGEPKKNAAINILLFNDRELRTWALNAWSEKNITFLCDFITSYYYYS